MNESLFSLDKSVIFREIFNNLFDVQNNQYTKGVISGTGIKFENGVVKFNGSSITYNTQRRRMADYTINILVNISSYPTFGNVYRFITLSGSAIIGCGVNPSGQLFTNAGTIYLNGTTVSTISLNTWNLVTWVIPSYDTGRYNKFHIASNPVGGENFYGRMKKIEIYNRLFSTSEIKLYNQNQLYSQSLNLPLLLDFDSTRGIIEDRTGLNTLTPSNVSIQRTGNVYSAYFNGSNSKIAVNINLPYTSLLRFSISIWFSPIKNSNTTQLIWCGAGSGTPPVIYWNELNNKKLRSYQSGSTDVCTSNTILSKKFYNGFVIFDNLRKKSYMYINGVLESSATLLAGTPPDTNLNYIGSQLGSSLWFKGFIPKLQIFQRIPSELLQDQFAAQLYNSQKGMFGL